MLYITFMYSSAVLTSKIILFGHSVTLAGVFMVPIVFSLSDIVAELYGYRVAKILVLTAFGCQILFGVICAIFIRLPSPSSWHGEASYQFVLGPLFRISIGSFLAYIFSSLLNVYFISRWKITLKGRYFWLRSIGASTLGEFFFTVMAVFFIQYGKLPTTVILQIIMTSYLVKLCLSVLNSVWATVIVVFAKAKIGEYSESKVDLFSPFK